MKRRSSYSSASSGGGIESLSRRPSLNTLDVLGNIGQAISDLFFESIGFSSLSSSASINDKYRGKNVLGDEKVDYHKEGEALLQRLNLDSQTIGEIKQRKIKKTVKAGEKEYNSLDPIYKKPHSPATIYVGDRHAASDINLLKRFRITSVVNCTRPAESGELPNYCQGTYIKYYEFPIATWSHYLFPNKSRDEWLSDKASTPQELAKVRDFFQRMFQFIQEALDRNESVLIHCLAGAHRAGSCGVAVLMYFLDLELAKAVFLAKLCRPIIDPIGSLPKVLMLLEEELKSKRKKNEMGGSFSQKVGSDVPLSRRQSFDKKSFDTENGTGQLRKVKSADQLKDEFNFNAGGGDIKLAPIFEPRKGSSKYKGKMLRASIDIAALGFLKEDNTISRFDRAMDQVKKLDSSLPNIGTKTLPNISTSNDNDIKFPSLTLKRVQSNKF